MPAASLFFFSLWFAQAAAPDVLASSPPEHVVDRVLDLDSGFLGAEDRDAFRGFADHLNACATIRSNERRVSCALECLLGPDGMKPAAQPDSLRANLATTAIVLREGSCAALVAAVLALTESVGDPFDAVVLRDHVVLGLRSTPGVYFEVLEGGRRLSEIDLRRHKMPPAGKPTRVGGREYLAYYLDNLAARLAEAGSSAAAERAVQKALEISPRAGRVHYNYGTLLLQEKRFREAADHLKLAIRFGWDDADAWINRGAALWKLGRLRAAQRTFEKALAKEPGNRQAAANLRALSEASGR